MRPARAQPYVRGHIARSATSGGAEASHRLVVRATCPWGSITNLRAAPLSKSAYPFGASSRDMTVAATALAICTRSLRMAIKSGLVCRSEEHTSELQSLRHLVCRLLLAKK